MGGTSTVHFSATALDNYQKTRRSAATSRLCVLVVEISAIRLDTIVYSCILTYIIRGVNIHISFSTVNERQPAAAE